MGAGVEPDGSSRSDEEWERFLRESVAGSADAPKEPSARAREVTRRLRAEPNRGPDGWRGAPSARPKRRVGRYVVGLPAVSALLFVALAPGRAVDLVTGSGSSHPSARTPTRTSPAGKSTRTTGTRPSARAGPLGPPGPPKTSAGGRRGPSGPAAGRPFAHVIA